MVKLAIDMMGSDYGPESLIPGVKSFLKDFKDLELHLFGDEEVLKKAFSESNVTVHHTTDIVPMEIGALKLLRLKESSMMQAITFTKEQDLDGVISAGSTGGFLTGATLTLKNIEGVRRAGFCAPFLTIIKDRHVAILDIGASNHNSPEDLVCFAHLGSIYARTVWKISNPGVYLLNNGLEEGKGPDNIKEAYQLLKEEKDVNFKGNVEARYVMDGTHDVVVTPGFDGNIFLKASEGMAMNMNNMIKTAFKRNIFSKIGYLLSKKGFHDMKEIMNYKKVGGAITLGLSKVVVKAHGNSDGYAFEHALIMAYEMAKANIVEEIRKEFNAKGL